jgi:hypothetical protein
MTMPHLMNCEHSDAGWCLDCVSKLYYEKQAAESNPPPDPRYGHAADELRYVANILDVLNADSGMLGVDGELDVFWVDRVMGVIGLNDKDDLQSWAYYPSANKNFELEDGENNAS